MIELRLLAERYFIGPSVENVPSEFFNHCGNLDWSITEMLVRVDAGVFPFSPEVNMYWISNPAPIMLARSVGNSI